MKKAKVALFVVGLLITAFLCQQIISLSIENQSRKQDYSEINNIKFGLFSINQWKVQLSDIINSEVSNFDVKDSEKKLKPLLEAQLNKLIDNVDLKIREKNKKTVKGTFKQAFINTFVDIKDIKSGIPEYADSIMKLMQKPSVKKNLKGMILDKVGQYFDSTFEEQDMTEINAIVSRIGGTDIEDAKAKLNEKIAQCQQHIFNLTWILLAVAVALFAAAGIKRERLSSGVYLSLVGVLFVLLVAGIMTPMIDLEAKISEMSFMLFDHPIKFLNQILYFQTKSVLDVFWIMITHADIQMKLVGILMVSFSVIFPVIKLFSSALYYYNHWNARKSKIVQFFVLKSGKWSMTDVMIIAIFMAYIGFNGIISSQFGKMQQAPEDVVLLTTNGTSLQPGFYLFLGYTVLAMFLSEFLMFGQTTAKTTEKTESV